MVRLKLETTTETNTDKRFQFHYGSIKTYGWNIPELVSFCFQFHYGSIKTEWHHAGYLPKSYFQFHYGSIKTKNK